MPTPSINIGICPSGKKIIQSIDDHFKHQEPEFHKNYILSSNLTINSESEEGFNLETIVEDRFIASDSEGIKTWFEYELYGEINNLVNLDEYDSNGLISFDGSINVNIVLPLIEKNSITLLESLLNSIKVLKNEKLIGGVSLKIFNIIYSIDNNRENPDVTISEQLDKFEEVSKEFNLLIEDIFYLDDKNINKIHLNLNNKWLGFALGEYFMFQMIQPRSLALTSKNKIFGLSIVHFNEVLFREVIANKILQYKFEEEGINQEEGVQLQDVVSKTNPFIKNHQDFFKKFNESYPFNLENDDNITDNAKNYILDFKKALDRFVEDGKNKIGESKVILANLLGENDDLLEGIDWKGERLYLKDLENNIIEYFNKFLKEDEQVDFTKEKKLRSAITHLKHGIKSDKKSIREIEDQSELIHSEIDISFDKGVFSVNGKRVNASGYIPSPLSPSDEVYSFNDNPIPERMDLSPYFSKVKNQGELGSCTAFTVASVYEFFANQNKQNVDISELFIYYNSREIKGNTSEDTGSTLFDTISSVKKKGACYSNTYPYDVDKFSVVPDKSAYNEAKHNIVEKTYRVNINEIDFKNSLANGHPVVFGLKLFKSFYPINTMGLVPYPKTNEISLQNHGNHAMLLVGYNDEEKLFKVRNSWGSQFGHNGYCYIPYDYLANPDYCLEAFVITKIVDLSFNEFNYDSSTSFSFLKNNLIRRKTILEYKLRAKNKNLSFLMHQYETIAYKNEENTIQIKDPLFRLDIYNNLKEEEMVSSPSSTSTSTSIEPATSNIPYIIMLAGVVLIVTSFALMPFITLIGSLIGALLSIGIIFYGWKLLNSKKEKKINTPTVIVPNQPNKKEQLYKFMIADRLFAEFDKLEKDLITNYRAVSSFYTKIRNWKEESLNDLNNVEFSSPTFVHNVLEEKPLLDFIENKKEVFLKLLPNFSTLFYRKFIPTKNNVDEVYDDLKASYLSDIKANIESILDVSIIEYLLGEKYPYFNDPPELSKSISRLEKISNPFCNVKSTEKIKSQHFAVYETIESGNGTKELEIAKHYNPSIIPIKVYRKNNRKKYVLIQVAALDDTNDIVRYKA